MSLPDEILRTITKEGVNELPVARYEGEIVLNPRDLDLKGETVVGFDTETRPAFKPGESYLPSLVQVATERAVYVFQVQQSDFSVLLRHLFESRFTVKVGVSVADDLKGLKKVFPFEEKEVLDLGQIAKRDGFKQTGVRNLAALLLGVRIPKGQKTTNWAAPRLTQAQIAYAATDAWVCRQLYLKFAERGMLAAR